MLGNIMRAMQDATMYATTVCILQAIKRNGLEKTLQDLQKVCRFQFPSSEEGYQDLLQICDFMREKMEERKVIDDESI